MNNNRRRLLEMAGILRRNTPDHMLFEGDEGGDDIFGDDDAGGDDGGDDIFGDDSGGDDAGGDGYYGHADVCVWRNGPYIQRERKKIYLSPSNACI